MLLLCVGGYSVLLCYCHISEDTFLFLCYRGTVLLLFYERYIVHYRYAMTDTVLLICL